MRDADNPDSIRVYLCLEGHIHMDVIDDQGEMIMELKFPVENAAMLCDRIREAIREYGDLMDDGTKSKRHLN